MDLAGIRWLVAFSALAVIEKLDRYLLNNQIVRMR